MVETQKNVVGNALSSSKEKFIAELLRKENLDRVNSESQPVHPKHGLYVKYGKRFLDFVLALAALIITSPINLILAVCTYFDVGRPILFHQTRMGKDGKEFQMVKFRNMTNERDAQGNLLPASQRVTKFGKFVRQYSLDELLNFWSVLKGDMSIIGPRPLPVFFEERISERHRMRTAVKPGLECPRMVLDNEIPKYHAQFENDIWYVEHIGFFTDCRMVFQLIKMVFYKKYRSMGASGGGSYFVGYDANGYATSLKRVCKDFPELEEAYQRYCEEQGEHA